MQLRADQGENGNDISSKLMDVPVYYVEGRYCDLELGLGPKVVEVPIDAMEQETQDMGDTDKVAPDTSEGASTSSEETTAHSAEELCEQLGIEFIDIEVQ